jgi:UDP-N-acetylmuramate--alanine ligase
VSAWQIWTPPDGSIPTLAVPSLEGCRRIHLVGVGGAGMRNLARLLAARGLEVSGSDIKDSASLAELAALGVRTSVGHDPAALGSPDVVVISSAIRPDNPELREASDRGISVWRRQQALAALAVGRRCVAVSGTHGKTTTTSLVATALERSGLDPTYLIGGDLNESGSGARHGDGNLFVFEADESDGSHVLIEPWVGVVTSIDLDHLDFYAGGIDEIIGSFAEFMARAEHVIARGDDPNVHRAIQIGGASALTYGFDDASDLVVTVGSLGPEGARGSVRLEDGERVDVRLQVDGAHNLLNAAAAIAVARLAGVPPSETARALWGFSGVHRRFEFRGRSRGAEFFDDYGHNPAEMADAVATARRRGPARVIALVQPHRFGRVQALWRELGASVAAADLVVVTDVYGASQEPIPGVTGKLVVDGVQLAAPGRRTVYLPHRRDVVTFLARELRAGDLVVTMGCGDVWMLADATLAEIREKEGAIP